MDGSGRERLRAWFQTGGRIRPFHASSARRVLYLTSGGSSSSRALQAMAPACDVRTPMGPIYVPFKCAVYLWNIRFEIARYPNSNSGIPAASPRIKRGLHSI